MERAADLQENIVNVLQEDNTIVFIMSHTGEYLSLLGGTNRVLYADGSVLIGKSYPDVLVKEKADYFQSLLEKVVATKEALEVNYELSSSDFLSFMKGGPTSKQKFKANLYLLEMDPQNVQHKIVWIVHNITENSTNP